MKKSTGGARAILMASLVLVSPRLAAEDVKGKAGAVSLDHVKEFGLVRAKVETTTYRGRRAVKLVPEEGVNPDADMFAVVPGTDFGDGTIDIDVAGAPRAGSPANMRGFIGVAFRIQPDNEHFEMLYVRPVNARFDDQLVRNHTTQYVSAPDFPWKRLRDESPGVYESWVDLEPGAWTHLRIVVAGKTAQLYVNGAPQPCLMVKDLKRGETRGRIALWAHVTTEAYFSGLAVK